MSCWTLASLQWQRESVLSLLSAWTGPDTGNFREEGSARVLASGDEVDGEAENVEGAVWPASLTLSEDTEEKIWYAALVLVLTSLCAELEWAEVLMNLMLLIWVELEEKLLRVEEDVWSPWSRSLSSCGISTCRSSVLSSSSQDSQRKSSCW